MKKRVISAIVFGLIFFPAFIFGGYSQYYNVIGGIYFILFTMFCGYVGTFEIMNMFYKKSPSLKILRFIVPALSSLFICSLHFFIATNYHVCIHISPTTPIKFMCMPTTSSGIIFWNIPWLCANIFYCFIVIIGLLLFSVFKKGASGFDAIASIFAFIYGGILLGLAFSIEYLHINDGRNGWKVFTYVYSIVCFTDIFAYVIGSKYGKHKLCPTISPNKSVEGAIGGTLIGGFVGTIAAFLIFFASNINNPNWDCGIGLWILLIASFFVFSIIVSIVSQIGDLVASKLKRTYEIKDFGNIMPGHGGVIDRFDSFILAGSFVFIVYAVIDIISYIFRMVW